MWFKFRTAIISVSILILALGNLLIFSEDCTMAKAQTIYVDCNGGGNYTTIQEALDNCSSGDTVYVWEGIYFEDIYISKKITFIGNGSNNTIINGSGTSNAVTISGDGTYMSGFTITGSGYNYNDAGIELSSVKNCIIKNISCKKNNHGIFLFESTGNIIINNSCTDNIWGIKLDSSDSNTILNNSCSNNECGIYIYFSDSVNVSNNVLNNSVDISVSNSIFNRFHNNSMAVSGIYLVGASKSDYNTHLIDMDNTVNGKSISYWKDKTSGTIPQNAGQIILANCLNVNIDNIKIQRTCCAINIGFSNNILIRNSMINSNSLDGINVAHSNYIQIVNNSIMNNRNNGISFTFSDNNLITNNKCNSNFYGISLLRCRISQIINNSCSYNNDTGIYLSSSDYNKIENCICDHNNIYGIRINYNFNKIINTSCSFNNGTGIYFSSGSEQNVMNNCMCTSNLGNGIRISESELNDVISTSCSNNNVNGILIEHSIKNNIKDSSFENNQNSGVSLIGKHPSNTQNKFVNISSGYNTNYGFYIYESNRVLIRNSFITHNDYGISMDFYSKECEIYENVIENNSNGFKLASADCKFNLIYRNIISNVKNIDAAFGNNSWYFNQEGNYWSDYTGLDNGANNRTKFDGIGDTELPHLGHDFYPFINRSGWLFPGFLYLYEPDDLDYLDNYKIHWKRAARANNYILEEDDNYLFDSPKIIYNGPNNYFNVQNKPRGIYFYRVRGINTEKSGPWSNIVEFPVGYLPEVPTNLHCSVYPDGNQLILLWDSNMENTVGYEIQYKTYGISEFRDLTNISYPSSQFIHKNLIDGQKYYYRLQARNEYGQVSGFTEVLECIPKDSQPPTVPKNFKAEVISNNSIILTWAKNTENDLAGYQIYINSTYYSINREYELIQTLVSSKSSLLVPNLAEDSTYYFKIRSYDEVPNYSNFSRNISAVTPDETHPSKPKGLKVIDRSYDNLTLQWVPNSENDVIGYYIFLSGSSTGPYSQINIKPIVESNFIVTGLNETTIYYFKIRAVDDAGLPSLYSDYASGITISKPKPPEYNRSIGVIEILEDNLNRIEINLLEIFWDPNNDILEFRAEGHENITIIINQDKGSVTLYPAKDWNGNETITFFAADGMFETAINVTIYVSSVNDPPEQPSILTPEGGIEIVEGESLDFVGECYDPDLVYGDKLEFYWYSNIQGKLGEGKELTNITLEYGQHLVTLAVFDRLGESENNSIYISVAEKGDDPVNMLEQLYNNLINLALVILFIVLLIILLLIFYKKRKVIKTRLDKEQALDESVSDSVEE